MSGADPHVSPPAYDTAEAATAEGRCGAKLKRRDGYCPRPPVRGMARCYHHGGASLVGVASPSFKHGRRSRVLPVGVRESYQRLLQLGPDLLSLEEDLATH